MNNRIIGNIGESTVVSLCNAVGIVATKPSEDINGWDFYLELPPKVDSSLPNDSQPPAIKAKVQVKTTTTQEKKFAIKVSTLEHLVNVQMPAFICFIELNNLMSIENIYLVHVGEAIISKVLRRIRECEVKNKKTNKTTITIHYKDEHKLEDYTGKCFQKNIESYIPNGMKSYINEKNTILKKVGFDECPHKFTVQFQGISVSDIEDISLGLKEGELECSIKSSTQKRFDVELPNKELPESDNVKISMKPQYLGGAIISFKSSRYAIPSLKYKFDVYKSAFATGKGSLNKLLFKNEYMQLVYDLNTTEQKFTTQFTNQAYKLNEIHNVLQLYNFAYQSKDTPLIMEIKSEKLDGVSKQEFQFGNLSENVNLEYFYIVDAVVDIVKNLNLPEDIEIELENLLEQKSHIKMLHTLFFHNNLSEMIFSCTIEKDIQQTEVPLLILPNIVLNNQIIGIALILISTVEKGSDIYYFKPIERILHTSFAIPIDEYKEEQFSIMKDEMDKKMEEKGYELAYVL